MFHFYSYETALIFFAFFFAFSSTSFVASPQRPWLRYMPFGGYGVFFLLSLLVLPHSTHASAHNSVLHMLEHSSSLFLTVLLLPAAALWAYALHAYCEEWHADRRCMKLVVAPSPSLALLASLLVI
ncbi:hypothetical protein [uncultured Lentibacter sp.]|uniref:hypothetical protein n=1 Tax=uncultured Lentibacter sp. TaxID=1659309 RepID=UPI0026040107|nr:hypothetical protein [uncultured Lentibacter sp.]